jgi:hypothetical protein
MAIKKSNVACVQRRNISQYDSGERCGPWASCFFNEQVESFKANQRAEYALHSAFHMVTGDPVYRDDEYGHLQVSQCVGSVKVCRLEATVSIIFDFETSILIFIPTSKNKQQNQTPICIILVVLFLHGANDTSDTGLLTKIIKILGLLEMSFLKISFFSSTD